MSLIIPFDSNTHGILQQGSQIPTKYNCRHISDDKLKYSIIVHTQNPSLYPTQSFLNNVSEYVSQEEFAYNNLRYQSS